MGQGRQYQLNKPSLKTLILLLTAVIAALFFSGCSFAPPHLRPAMAVPNTWPSPKDRPEKVAVHLRWREFFQDPRLQAKIETALCNNRDLHVAISRVELARSLYRVQRADLFPQVNGQATPFRTKIPGVIVPTDQSITARIFAGFLNASWEIDLWGRIRNLDAAALNNWLATDEARRAVTLSLIAEVANTWLLARELDERIVLAHRTIESRRESDRIVRRRYELGYSPLIDLTQADAQLGEAESALLSLEQQREQTHNALAVLLGAPDCDEIITLSSVENALVKNLPPGCPSELLLQRPDIRGAEDRLRASEANIGAARAAFFPRIALFGDYGSLNAAFTNNALLLPGGTESAWIYGANAVAPIFTGGRLLGNLAGAKAERAMAIAEYQKTVQMAFRDVSDALAARRWLKQNVTTQQKTLASLAERSRLANLRYRTGSSTYLEVLEAQRDLFDAEQTLAQTRRARLSSEVNLYAALGGSCEDPSACTAAMILKQERSFP